MNTKIIKLDINNKMYETITAKQGDTESRFLLFHLFDSSLPFDLTEKSVRVYGIKPDETKIFNDLVINDVKKGYCTLELTNQMLAISGLVKLELVIYSGNKKLSSIPFVLNVISSLNSDDAVVSTNEFTALMNGLAALSEYDIYKSNAKQVPGIKEEVSNLSSQLDNNVHELDSKKMNKNDILSMANMGQDIKEAMTGGSVAVVGKNSVLSENIVDNQVTINKVAFAEHSKNLFDGKFTFGCGMSGSMPNWSFNTSIQDGVCAIIKLKKEGTFTISRYSDSTNRFGIATFVDYPEHGTVANRQIAGSVNEYLTVTVTLQGDEEYIVVYLSNASEIPSKLQVEEGKISTDFEDYNVVKINLSKESIPKITYDMTSFVKKGKNIFDGSYYKNIALGGSGVLKIQTSNNAITHFFKGEIGKTYTITRYNEGNRFGVATFSDIGLESKSIRCLNENTASWVSKTITLNDNENYIGIYVSNNNEKIKLQIEEGYESTSYSSPEAVSILLDEQPVAKTGKIAWFGDSISELKALPHRVEKLINQYVYDCSFAGSVMSYRNYDNYEKLGFRRLADGIFNNDFSLQEEAITDIETNGSGSNKRPNFNTLKSLDFNEIDKIVVFLGTNDFGAGSGSMEEFKNGMRYAIEKILSKYPHLQFYFITPMWRGDTENANDRGYKLIDYVNAEIEVANEYNFPIFNFYYNCGINKFNVGTFLNDDRLHQNDKGDIILSNKIANFLQSC